MKEQEKPIPCKQCISYAICNARIKQMKKPDVTRFSEDTNCIYLQDYIRLNEPREEYSLFNCYEIDKARKFFNLPLLFERTKKRL
jgi:hypothetical protein